MTEGPAVSCFYCGDGAAACDRCTDAMREGVILIEVRDGETGQKPKRAGGFAVITEDGLRRALSPEAFEAARARRCAFVPTSAWRKLGLDATGTGTNYCGSRLWVELAEEEGGG